MSDTLSDIARNVRAEHSHGDPSNMRKHGRVRASSVWCSHGTVLDLSAGGVRLRRTRAMSGDQVLRLQAEDEGLTVRARVVWAQKLGFRKHEIGLEFYDLPDRAKTMIRRLATM